MTRRGSMSRIYLINLTDHSSKCRNYKRRLVGVEVEVVGIRVGVVSGVRARQVGSNHLHNGIRDSQERRSRCHQTRRIVVVVVVLDRSRAAAVRAHDHISSHLVVVAVESRKLSDLDRDLADQEPVDLPWRCCSSS